MLRLLGALLGWLAGSVLRIRRRHVEASMRAAGIAPAAAEARAMYASLGASAMEFLWMAARGRAVLDRVRFDEASRARWQEVLGRGRGVVVAASHTGNWDWPRVPSRGTWSSSSSRSISASAGSTGSGNRRAPASGFACRTRTAPSGAREPCSAAAESSR